MHCTVSISDMEKILKRWRYNAAYNQRVRARQKQARPTVIYNSDNDFDSNEEDENNTFSPPNSFSVLQPMHVACRESSAFNDNLHPHISAPLNALVDSHLSNGNFSLSDTDIGALSHNSVTVTSFSYAAQSSDSSESEDEKFHSVADDIRHLRLMDYVIDMFRRRGYKYLPASRRTVLNTPRHVDIKQVAGMEYYYFDVQKQIKVALGNSQWCL